MSLFRKLWRPSIVRSALCSPRSACSGAQALYFIRLKATYGVAVFAFAFGMSSLGHAQEAKPTTADIKAAGAAFDRGRVAYEAEQYVQAAENFEAADSSAPSSAALRLAVAMRYQAGQIARAASLAELALIRYPEDEKLVSEAQVILEEAKVVLLRLAIDCDEACELAVDGKLQHAGRVEEHIVLVEPGEHQLSVGWTDDRSESQVVSGSAGEEKSIRFKAPIIPVAPPVKPKASSAVEEDNTNYEPWAQEPAPIESTGWKPVVFWTSLGVTVAGAGASTGLTIWARNNPGKDAVVNTCQKGDRECPAFQEGLKNQRIATIAWGATGAAAAFTLVTGIWLTDWSKPSSSAFLNSQQDHSTQASKMITFRRGDFSVTPSFTAGQLELGQGASVFATGTF